MRFRDVIGAGLVVLSAASCSLDVPSNVDTINVFVGVDLDGALQVGDSVTITVTARNVGVDPLTLNGPSDCLLYAEVVNSLGSVVWRSNTPSNCGGNIVNVDLVVGVDRVQTFVWRGTSDAGERVSSGYYQVRGAARLTGAAYLGPSIGIAVE